MNKKGTKKLSGALAATTVLTSVAGATPAFAQGTNWDAIYKTAYEAMQKAEADKTQESINAARKAINELAKSKDLKTMAATLSEKVDGVQQGLFNDLYALMYVNGKEKEAMTQDEINKAKALVLDFGTYEGNKNYITSWSTAIDKYQQANINKATEAIKKAEESKKSEDIKAARTLVNELLKSADETVKKAAKELDTTLAKVEAEAAKLVVENVKSTNNKEIMVTFNKAVDKNSAEDIANYRLVTKGYSKNASIGTESEAKLLEDGKTVIVSLTNNAKNQDKSKLEISNVKDLDGKVIETTSKEFTFFDSAVPTVTGLTVVGPKEVEVELSEPMKLQPTVTLDNGQVSSSVDFKAGAKKFTVIFPVKLTGGSHKLTIKGGEDYATYKIVETIKEFKYTENKESIQPKIEKASQDEATIKFNKPVKIKDSSKVKVYHSYNNSKNYEGNITAVKDVKGYSDTYKVKFAIPMSEKEDNKIFLNTKKDAFEDRWGNDVETTELLAPVVVDVKAPVVNEIVSEADNEFTIKFNKAIERADAEKAENYILKDENGKIVSNRKIVDKDGHFTSKVKIQLLKNKQDVKVTLPVSLEGTDYTLTINGIKDTTYNKNEMKEQNVDFTVKDTTAPSVKYAITNGSKIRLVFSENMNSKGLDDINNYSFVQRYESVINSIPKAILVQNISKDADVKIIDAKTVEIDLVDAAKLQEVKFIEVNGNLTDASGNKIEGTSVSLDVKQDKINKNTIKDVQATGRKTIKFTVKQELKEIDRTKFAVKDNTIDSAEYENKNGECLVTLTLHDSLNTNAKTKNNNNVALTINEGALTNKFETRNDTISSSDITIEDKTPAEIETIVVEDAKVANIQKVSANKISIAFTEDMQEASISNQTFVVDGFTVKTAKLDDTKKILTLELEAKDENILESGVKVTQGTAAVEDLQGNKSYGLSGKVLETQLSANINAVFDKLNKNLDLSAADITNCGINDDVIKDDNMEAIKNVLKLKNIKTEDGIKVALVQVRQNLAKINEGKADVTNYKAAGIKGVTEDNLKVVNNKVEAAQKVKNASKAPLGRRTLLYAAPQIKTLTAKEIQTIVDGVVKAQ